MNYICELCKREFKQKSQLVNHNKRKNPCVSKNIELLCGYCGLSFVNKYSLKRHETKNCKKQSTNNLEIIYKELLEQFKIQNDKIIQLENENKKIKEKLSKTKINTTINSNSNNNNNNNITNNNYINIVAFGKEDISFITKNDWIQIMNQKYMSVKHLVEKIHFNEAQPQNSNIYISNLKDNYGMYYNGNKWIIEKKDDLLTNIIDTKTDCLEEKFYEIIDELPKKLKDKFQEFLDTNDDDNYLNKIKEEIKLMLYNKKDIPMKIIKDNEKALIYN